MIVRGICISDSMPSCIRAPPEDGITIRAALCLIACSAAWTMPSPTAVPIDPPIKAKLNAAITVFCPPISPLAMTMASFSLVLALLSFSLSAYFFLSLNFSGSWGTEGVSILSKPVSSNMMVNLWSTVTPIWWLQ